MKILMVCLGNICRSPLAQGILQHLIEQHQLDWDVDSAGTGAWHIGNPPDPRSIAIAQKYGIDISHQRARKFYSKDFERFDRIYVMDTSNYRNILKMARTEAQKNKVSLILNEVSPNTNQSVPDPYWDDDGFQQVYDLLIAACRKIINN